MVHSCLICQLATIERHFCLPSGWSSTENTEFTESCRIWDSGTDTDTTEVARLGLRIPSSEFRVPRKVSLANNVRPSLPWLARGLYAALGL
jgi:hypothetical protein